VVVADNHPLYRDGIVRAIRRCDGLEVVGEVADGRQALAAIEELVPDVAVLNIKLPELNALQVLNAVSAKAVATRILVLAEAIDGAVVLEALAAGAAGYLSKAIDRHRIRDAIIAVARGETLLSPEAQAAIAGEVRAHGRSERPRLTKREQEVLALISQGHTAPQIAQHLYLSTATVKGHLQSLYEKLGVSERAAAVAEGIRRGFLE
jgi:two-component system, NarL family, nitrate/nitrite response regulator NarL